MSGSGKGVSGMVRISWNEVRAGTFPDKKAAALDWVEQVSCAAWRPGYCMVDGTLIPLFEKPGHFGEMFFDRKSNYSLSLMVWSYF